MPNLLSWTRHARFFCLKRSYQRNPRKLLTDCLEWFCLIKQETWIMKRLPTQTSKCWLTDKHSRLVRFAQLTQAISTTNRFATVRISLDDRYRINRWNDSRHESNSTNNVVDVNDVCVAFSCTVLKIISIMRWKFNCLVLQDWLTKLADPWDVEPAYKLRPYLRSQSITKHHSELMRCISLLSRRWKTVATHFSDVLCNLEFN